MYDLAGWSSNFVSAPENRAMIGGAEDRGYILVIPQGWIFAATAQGMGRLLEEFHLPEIGWS